MAVDDLENSGRRDSEVHCKAICRETPWLHRLFEKHFAWVDRWEYGGHDILLLLRRSDSRIGP